MAFLSGLSGKSVFDYQAEPLLPAPEKSRCRPYLPCQAWELVAVDTAPFSSAHWLDPIVCAGDIAAVIADQPGAIPRSDKAAIQPGTV